MTKNCVIGLVGPLINYVNMQIKTVVTHLFICVIVLFFVMLL